MKEFRFAIMGAGHIAEKFCAAAALVEGCCIAAVASKSRARAESFAQRNGLPAFYDSYEAMLRREKPDCVYIATTPSDHYALAMLCLAHGTPVLCEKAMFRTGWEAETFFAQAEAAGIFAMEALWSRFLPAIRAVSEWLRRGEIGKVVLAEVAVGFAAPFDPHNRYFDPNLGGGAMYDLSVYGHELLTGLLGPDAQLLWADVTWGETGVDVTEAAALRLAGAIPALLTGSLVTPLDERLVLYGTRGKIVVPHPHYADEALLLDAEQAVRARFTDQQTRNGFTYELAEVMRCVRGGLTQSDVVPHRDTLACARFFDRLLETKGKGSTGIAAKAANDGTIEAEQARA